MLLPGPKGETIAEEQMCQQLAEALGLPNSAQQLLREAFSHPSYVREAGRSAYESNQRLEFLGDAIIDAVIADELYARFPEMTEGWLTRAKAAIVRTANLARVARELELGKYLLLGRGEENSGGRTKTSLLADVLEALVGAIYLSAGWAAAQKFVLGHLLDVINEVEDQSFQDAKTTLQELFQAHTQSTPQYVTVSSTGPPHAPVFEVEVGFGERVLGRGTGHNKQQAEQAAARAALAEQEQWIAELASD